jgi:hypothetical protein
MPLENGGIPKANGRVPKPKIILKNPNFQKKKCLEVSYDL